MSRYPLMPLFTDAWVAATHHMPRALRGLYHDLLVLMWRTPGCRVPNDDTWLAARLGMTIDEVIAQLRPIIAEFCETSGNWITQKRLAREYARASAMSEKQSVRAKTRWEKEKSRSHGNAIPGNAPRPIPTLSEPNGSARGVHAAKKSPRGMRWDPARTVLPGWLDDGLVARRRNMLPDIDLHLEAERFANYWSGATGQRAKKIDWHRTWINWVLDAKGTQHGRQAPAEKFFNAAVSVARRIAGDQAGDDDAEGPGPDAPGPALPPA